MHRKSSIQNTTGVDQGRRSEKVGQAVYCGCGCGEQLFKNKWGRQQRFVLGHQARARAKTRPEWEVDRLEVISKKPLCACGCGDRVRSKHAETLDEFIKYKGARGYYKYISGHDRRKKSWHYRPTKIQEQAIYGTLLGDSSIVYPNKKSTAPRIMFNHGEIQEDWVRYKALFLHGLDIEVERRKNGGYGEFSVRGVSKCNEFLKEVYDNVRTANGKIVTTEWLDRIGGVGLCWWLCDDGSQSGGGFTLHTEGFSDDEREIIASWFRKNYGEVSISSSRGYKYLYLSAECMGNIYQKIKKHIPKPMRYKFIYRGLREKAKKEGTRVRHNDTFDGELFCKRDSGS